MQKKQPRRRFVSLEKEMEHLAGKMYADPVQVRICGSFDLGNEPVWWVEWEDDGPATTEWMPSVQEAVAEADRLLSSRILTIGR